MMATGTTVIMAVAEYDLSVGAMAGLGGVVAAETGHRRLPAPGLLPGRAALGGLLGASPAGGHAASGVLSFITTLAAGTIYAGLALQISGGATVFENIPPSFTDFGQATWGSVPLPSM